MTIVFTRLVHLDHFNHIFAKQNQIFFNLCLSGKNGIRLLHIEIIDLYSVQSVDLDIHNDLSCSQREGSDFPKGGNHLRSPGPQNPDH